ELGRALAAEPRLLLLDEPMAGMTLQEKLELCRFIVEVNRSQGTTVLLVERGFSSGLSFALSLSAMLLLGVAIERVVLRPLRDRPPITLFLATLGLSFVIEGLAQTLWGAQVHGLELGIDDVPLEFFGVSLSQFDLFAAAVALGLVGVLGLLFTRTRIGLALRAVANDQQAALAVGIALPWVWGVVWATAG